jgi:phosphonate degradation associated HDIG domain protein
MENKNQVVDYIIELFNAKGGDLYGGEAVTQLQHGLQAAHHAYVAKSSDALITAALLHDIGHLIHDLPDDATERGIDDLHEELGAVFLKKYFIPAVVEPVNLHVAAKRYLCLVEPSYHDTLSPISKSSLLLQGGIMNNEEKENFEKNEFYKDAVVLRKWDDLAKDPDFSTNSIEFYKDIISNSLK